MVLNDLVVKETDSILAVLQKINLNGHGIAFVANAQGKFLGVITDGDVRRGLLNKVSLEAHALQITNKSAITGLESEDENEWIARVQAAKAQKRVTTLPILDRNQKIVSYYSYRETLSFPVSKPTLQGNEIKYVIDCIETNWISSQGNYIVEFENEFAKKYGAKHALTTMNGTVALHLAVHALGIGPGDEVLVPSFTFAASVNSILHAGATPILVDVCKENGLIDVAHAEKLITPKTKAIMPVHLYGIVCNMDEVFNLARKHNLKIIEDCAEAQGATYRSKSVGTLGNVGCFSFFANKIMTTGEGGMCITNDTELYHRMKMLRDHGIDRSKSGYFHALIGYNYRMTNLQAAIGLAQLERIETLSSNRARLEKKYKDGLKDLPEFRWLPTSEDSTSVCWLVSAMIQSDKFTRDELLSELKRQGVDSRPFFLPMHEMEIYRPFVKGKYPVSEQYGLNGVNFPTSSQMADAEADQIISIIRKVVTELKKR